MYSPARFIVVLFQVLFSTKESKRDTVACSFWNHSYLFVSRHKTLSFYQFYNFKWNIQFTARILFDLTLKKRRKMNLISEFNQFYHVTSPLSLKKARFFLPVISATFSGPPRKLIKRSRGLGGSCSPNSSTSLVSAFLIHSSFSKLV